MVIILKFLCYYIIIFSKSGLCGNYDGHSGNDVPGSDRYPNGFCNSHRYTLNPISWKCQGLILVQMER